MVLVTVFFESSFIKKDENLFDTFLEVAEEFESLFLNEMLKRANAAKLAKSILSNDEQETYTSLLNQERAKLIAKSQSFGIAEALVNQFSRKEDVSNKLFKKLNID